MSERLAAVCPLASTDTSTRSFGNPKYADLKVVCGDEYWHVSKAIVCPQSKWFDKMCYGEFKVSERGVETTKPN